MMPYKAQVSNANRLGATRIAVPFEHNRRVHVPSDSTVEKKKERSAAQLAGLLETMHCGAG